MTGLVGDQRVVDGAGREYTVTVHATSSAWWPWGLNRPALLRHEKRGERTRWWLGVRTLRIPLPTWLGRRFKP